MRDQRDPGWDSETGCEVDGRVGTEDAVIEIEKIDDCPVPQTRVSGMIVQMVFCRKTVQTVFCHKARKVFL